MPKIHCLANGLANVEDKPFGQYLLTPYYSKFVKVDATIQSIALNIMVREINDWYAWRVQ